MRGRWRFTAMLSLAIPAGLVSTAPAQIRGTGIVPATASTSMVRRSSNLPMEALPAKTRDVVQRIVQQPTIVARAEPEEFPEGIYGWLVENPDRASLAWRRLGIPCAAITARAEGGFGWTDGQGTEVSWRTVFKNEAMHVWLAEGKAKLGPMTPTIPVKAVAILHHQRKHDRYGRPLVEQQTEVYLQTDSKAASVVARILGPAVPRLADTGASQLLLFFSGLTRYFDSHPEDIRSLLAPAS